MFDIEDCRREALRLLREEAAKRGGGKIPQKALEQAATEIYVKVSALYGNIFDKNDVKIWAAQSGLAAAPAEKPLTPPLPPSGRHYGTPARKMTNAELQDFFKNLRRE